MAVETWWRNPHNYIKEVAEVRHPLIAFHRGVASKKGIDPVAFCDLYLRDQDWRCLLVGPQGTMEYSKGDKVGKPTAVYATWSYGDPVEQLEDLLAMNVGMIESVCENKDIPRDERPVLGQEHRVVIINLPPVNHGPGRRVIRMLSEMQEQYPEAIIHLNGLYSMMIGYSGAFPSVDMEPRTSAAKGNVFIGAGKKMRYERTVDFARWVHLTGMSIGELCVPRNRCIFNMRSMLWASKHFADNYNFSTKKIEPPDPDSPDREIELPRRSTSPVGSLKTKKGDKMLCNICTLQTTCTYFRQGAVCSVPGSEPVELSKFFKTRDSDQIIEGLGTLLATQANRLKDGMEDERLSEELDPEVTKVLHGLFDRGVVLAKLVNPSLNGKPGTQIGVQINSSGGPQASIKALTAAVVAELEEKGVARDKITPEMVMNLVSQPDETARRQAITATVQSETAIDVEEA